MDFFPVSVTGKEGFDNSVNDSSVRHVLKTSYGGNDCYVIGTYSSETETFSADSEFNTAADLRYDYEIYLRPRLSSIVLRIGGSHGDGLWREIAMKMIL